MQPLVGNQSRELQREQRTHTSRSAGRGAAWIERFAPTLIVAIVLAYMVIFAAAACLKYAWYGQGNDLVLHEQAIWNTVQGRPFQITSFVNPPTLFGYDPFLIEFLVVPLYALFPSAYTLLILQSLVIGIGAIPLYLLASDLFEKRVYGLFAVLLYLLYPSLNYLNLDAFRARAIGMALFLWAFYFYHRRRFWPFLLLLGLASLCKVEIALVAACFGLYALLERRRWTYVAAPILLGLGWFFFATQVFVPLVNNGQSITYFFKDYYGHLGQNMGEVVRTIFTQPGMVAQLVFTPDKVRYLGLLLLPLAGLPLLRPRLLVFTVPILALNLLSTKPQLWDTRYWYQAMLIPALVLAAVYAVHWLLPRLQRLQLKRPDWLAQNRVAILLALVLGIELVVNVLSPNALVSLLRNRESPARVAAANEMVALIPPEARVAATGRLATHLVRQYLYYFPLADLSVWPAVDYFALDLQASALQSGEGEAMLARLATDPSYTRVFQREGFALYARNGQSLVAWARLQSMPG